MGNGSTRRFGIVSDLSGLSQGFLVNDISVSNNYQIAEARNEKGQVIDIATYSLQKQISLDGLYVSSGVAVGSKVKVNDQTFLVTNTSISETNNNFQRMSLNARLCPDQEFVPVDPAQFGDALMFKAVNDIGGIAFNQYGSPTSIEIKYKKNYGEWTTYTLGDSIILNKNDIVAFSGANDHLSLDSSNYYYFTVAGDIEASGQVQSLMNFSDSVGEYDYYRLFYNCGDLKTAPQLAATNLAVNCYDSMFYGCSGITSPIALPAETVAAGCYRYMFANCTSLEDAPPLISNDVESACYQGMFAGCTSLTEAPYLYASTLATDCYKEMFSGCSNLNKVTVFFQDWGENNTEYTTDWMVGTAEEGMFGKVEQLDTVIGTSNIPTDWNVVDMGYDPPEPPDPPPTSSVGDATIVVETIPNIDWDFSNATTSSLNLNDYVQYDGSSTLVYTVSPSLPPGVSLADGILSADKDLMTGDINETFTITISASDAEESATATITIVVENVEQPQPEPEYENMALTFKAKNNPVNVCLKVRQQWPDPITMQYSKNDGTWNEYTLGDQILLNDGDTVSFSGANEYFNKDYNNWYGFTTSGNGSLFVMGNLSSLITTNQTKHTCQFFNLFDGCTNIVDASKLILPTPDAQYYYQGTFQGCNSLTAIPTLPVSGLGDWCYRAMFRYCNNLSTIPTISATSLRRQSFGDMFEGCTSLVSANISVGSLGQFCFTRMFQGCTSLSSIEVNFTVWSHSYYGTYTHEWVKNVSTSGVFIKPTALPEEYSTYDNDYSRIPSGWTVINK